MLADLSASHQNYIKALWNLGEWSSKPVSKSALAECVGVKLSTASDAVRKLQELHLVHDTRYGAVTLTELGQEMAVAMVRRHRLIETFLVRALDYNWDQVHAEAEVLEHAVSDFLTNRIDEKLGFPERDPHGDPIPRRDGTMPTLQAIPLAQAPVGASVVVERISDSDPELLRYFERNGILLGVTLELKESDPYSGGLSIQIAENRLQLGVEVAKLVWVSVK
ncbi:metal-dependent transcriptional regulator [Staphylococcus chromogenes]|nr:metal-dependent transcriptional regulator [Staphylococcus chromogenes]